MMDTFQDSSLGFGDDSAGDLDTDILNQDVPTLFRRWRNEKYSPEILPFDAQVVDNMCEVTEFVAESLLEEMNDAKNSQPEDLDSGLHVRLRRIDLDRSRYLLRDYLRLRLWKLTQYPQHYLEPAHMELLSDAERTFLRDFWDAKRGYLENRLLGGLPPQKQALTEEMVRRPVVDRHVYARFAGEVGAIEVPPSATQGTQSSPTSLSPKKGDTIIIRYSLVRKFLMDPQLDGSVELV